MTKYAVLSGDGLYVDAVASGPVVPPGAIELPGEFDLNAILRCYVVDGALLLRPEVPPPVSSAAGVQVAGCPPGTVINVYDVEDGGVLGSVTTTEAAPGVDFGLPDPGRYQVEVVPPFPYIGGLINHEVSG